MKFLADENFPLAAVRAMQRAGHDVPMVRDLGLGMSDGEVLRAAREQQRILLTLDRDFGELVFLRDHAPPPAVIFVRAEFGDPIDGPRGTGTDRRVFLGHEPRILAAASFAAALDSPRPCGCLGKPRLIGSARFFRPGLGARLQNFR